MTASQPITELCAAQNNLSETSAFQIPALIALCALWAVAWSDQHASQAQSFEPLRVTFLRQAPFRIQRSQRSVPCSVT